MLWFDILQANQAKKLLRSDVAAFLSGAEIALTDGPDMRLGRLVPADQEQVVRFRAG